MVVFYWFTVIKRENETSICQKNTLQKCALKYIFLYAENGRSIRATAASALGEKYPLYSGTSDRTVLTARWWTC